MIVCRIQRALQYQFSISKMESPPLMPDQGQKKQGLADEESKFNMFESVIYKYFEIIRSVMPKITSLTMQNQEFEKSIFTLENKMSKIEKDQENLHFEVRANFVTIDSKLNSILADHSNILLQHAKIRKQNEDLSREIKEVRYFRAYDTPVVQVTPAQSQEKNIPNKSGFTKAKAKKIAFVDEALQKDPEQTEKQPQPLEIKSRVSIAEKGRKGSISLEEQSSFSQKADKLQFNISSKNEIFNSQKMLELTEQKISKSMKSQRAFARKGTIKSANKLSTTAKKPANLSKSHKIILQNHQQEYDTQKMEQLLRQMQNFHRNNQIMKNNYEQLMGEYCRVNQQQFNRIDGQLKDLKKKIEELNYYHVHMEKIKLTLDNKINHNAKDLENKLQGKINKIDFNEFMIDVNNRITTLHEERKRVANKEQTKRAIQFLQDKLNTLFQVIEPSEHSVKLHLVNLQAGTLRSRASQFNQRPITNQQSRYQQMLLSKSSNLLVSQHERKPTQQVESSNTTQRQAQSLHSRFKNERRFNEDLNEFRMYSIEKNNDEAKTIRKQTPPKQRTNFNLLREKSKDLLGKQKPKTRNKLKRQPLIFQYDS